MLERGGEKRVERERGSVVSKILCTFESLSGIRIFFEIKRRERKRKRGSAES